MKQNFVTRSISSVFLLAALIIWMFIGAVYLDKPFSSNSEWASYLFMAVNSFLLLVAMFEIMNLRKKLNWSLTIKISIFALALLCLWFPFGNENYAFYKNDKSWFTSWMDILFYALVILIIFSFSWKSKKFTYNDVSFILTWGFYLVLTFKGINFLMLQTDVNSGLQLGWPTLLYVWTIVISSDVGAYLGGMMFGKKPMAPKISPKKTWEGAISGFIVAVVLSMIVVTLLFQVGGYYPLPIVTGNSGLVPVYIIYIGISCVLAFISQLGDLLFSYLKRNHEVKDFSKIIPGHGGLLDRFDSLSAVCIITYLLTMLLMIN